MTKKKKVVILGGGFAGLRIAYLLNNIGYQISLIEKTKSLGGMVQTFKHEYKGERFLFDFGPHLFFEDYVHEYLNLLGDDLINLADRFCMYTKKTILSYPLRPIEFITKMNPIISILYILDSLISWTMPDLTGKTCLSLEGYMRKRFGKKLFNDFYSPYIEKCSGLLPNQISVLWAKERENVSGKSLLKNITNKIKAQLSNRIKKQLAKSNDPSAEIITSWYPRHGAGQLCDAMVNVLSPKDIYLNTKIESINIEGNTVQNVIVNVGGIQETILGDYYVSTLPLPLLITLFNPSDPKQIEATNNLHYAHVRLVNLIINKEKILDSLEMFSMNRQHIFKRVYEPKAMSRIMAPSGKTSLCLEVCCNTGDLISNMSNEKIVSKCIEDLIDIKLLDSFNDVLDSFIMEIPEAYPIYRKGFEIDRQILLDEISKFNNLLTCGRQGLFRYHAMTNEIMEMSDSVVRFLENGFDKNLEMNTPNWGQSFY